MPSSNRFARHVLDASVYLAWLGGMSAFAFFIYLERHSPSGPSVLTGQVAEMNNHGYLFYVRPWEKLTFNLGLPASLGVAAALALLRYKLYGDADLKHPTRLQTLIPILIVLALWAYMSWPVPQ